jgi:hypothetical protein
MMNGLPMLGTLNPQRDAIARAIAARQQPQAVRPLAPVDLAAPARMSQQAYSALSPDPVIAAPQTQGFIQRQLANLMLPETIGGVA